MARAVLGRGGPLALTGHLGGIRDRALDYSNVKVA